MNFKVLMCAYACLGTPDKRFSFVDGGEGGLGWNAVKQVGKIHQLSVLTHSQNRKFIEKRLDKEQSLNIKFYYISLPHWLDFLQNFHGGVQLYAYFWQIRAYFVAKKLHKKNRFDIFHHVTFANDWMASFIGALLPIPYIRGPGGGSHRVPKSFLPDFSFAEKMSQHSRNVAQWFFKHDPFFIIGQNKAKIILVCNKEAFNALPKKWQAKATYFPVSAVANEDFGISPNASPQKDFFIATAGRLIKIKGFDLAIKSFKLFNDKVPQSKLAIIGDGPELQNLKKIASDLKLQEKVIFMGWMPHKKLLEEISAFEIFLFLSLRDGGGAVVVEAMANGKPVVCLDIAGPGFYVSEDCGIKIIPHSPGQVIPEVSEALMLLYKNKDLRKKLGNAARLKAENLYSWDKLGEQLLKMYEEII